jgi:SLT domain-containing protein
MQTIGLGIDSGLNLLTQSTASHAHVQLQAAMALIKQAYGKLNNPPSTASTGTSNAPVPAYLQTQLAGYQTALAWMQTLNQSQ